MKDRKSLPAFLLPLLGGLWMIVADRIVYGRFGNAFVHRAWRGRHMIWGHGMMWPHGVGWPWLGVIAGSIVVVSAIGLLLYPRYQRSFAITILVCSVINLFVGMGGFLASILGITGGIVGLTSIRKHQT